MEVGKMEQGEAQEGKARDHLFCYMTVLFTAGTAMLTVGLRMCLAEHWRAWVFLTLNVVLLAIVFTSMSPPSSKEDQEEDLGCVPVETKTKRRKEQREQPCELVEEWHDCCTEELHASVKAEDEQGSKGEDGEGLPQMSKEELNERVEAFIAMFRQHLILDAKNGR